MQAASLTTVAMTLAIVNFGNAAESTAARDPRSPGFHLLLDGPLNDSVSRTLDKIDTSVNDYNDFAHRAQPFVLTFVVVLIIFLVLKSCLLLTKLFSELKMLFFPRE